MMKKRWYTIGLIVCFLLAFSSLTHAGIELNSSPLTLTLVANDNGAADLGHAFLIVRNNTGRTVFMNDFQLPSGDQATIGLRGGEPWIEGQGGSYINSEACICDVYKDFNYVTCAITQKQLNWIVSYFAEKSSYYTDAKILLKNCTTTASYAWNHVCTAQDKVMLYNVPASLKKRIAKCAHSKNGSSLTGSGLLSRKAKRYNAFFLSKSGTLTPVALQESAPGSGKCTSAQSTITISWKQPSVKIVNKYTKRSYATGYLLKYRKKSETSFKEKYVSGLSSTKVMITGLKPDTEYYFELYPACAYHLNKKSGYITGREYLRKTIATKGETVSIRLSPTRKTIYVGNSFTIKSVVTGISRKAVWSSSNAAIATVNANGKVTGKRAGTAIITAKVGGKTAICKVTVRKSSGSKNKVVYYYGGARTSSQYMLPFIARASVKGNVLTLTGCLSTSAKETFPSPRLKSIKRKTYRFKLGKNLVCYGRGGDAPDSKVSLNYVVRVINSHNGLGIIMKKTGDYLTKIIVSS